MAPFFSQLLDLAAVLLVAPAEATVSAGCELYALLMSVFPADQKRQVRQHLYVHTNRVLIEFITSSDEWARSHP